MEKHSPGRHLSKILESQLILLYLGWNFVESGVKHHNPNHINSLQLNRQNGLDTS
jgi:hypothetical protein